MDCIVLIHWKSKNEFYLNDISVTAVYRCLFIAPCTAPISQWYSTSRERSVLHYGHRILYVQYNLSEFYGARHKIHSYYHWLEIQINSLIFIHVLIWETIFLYLFFIYIEYMLIFCALKISLVCDRNCSGYHLWKILILFYSICILKNQ